MIGLTRWSRFITPALVIALGAVVSSCSASTQYTEMNRDWSRLRPSCSYGPRFLFEDARYNGTDVKGLVLVTGGLEPLQIDESDPEADRFYYGPNVISCKTGERLATMSRMPEGCYYPDDCKPVRVQNGYWFGRDILLEFFAPPAIARRLSPDMAELSPITPGPRDCIEFDLLFGPAAGHPKAALRIRAERNGPVKAIATETCGLKDEHGRLLYPK